MTAGDRACRRMAKCAAPWAGMAGIRVPVVSTRATAPLNAPPRGQQWVQVGSDYVLIAIATGIIAQLVLSQ